MQFLIMRNARLWLIALSCISIPAGAQSPESLDLTAVGKDPRWKVAGRMTSIVAAKGKHALKIGEGAGMGTVWLEAYDLTTGVIELAIPGLTQPIHRPFLPASFPVSHPPP